MSAYTYILFSNKLDRFYIGSTELPISERLELHLHKSYGNKKFTAKADDWILSWYYSCDSIVRARKLERFIKKMKSSRFIERLIRDKDIVEDIMKKL